MENFGILFAILFFLLFGGLILAMVIVGTALMVWLWIQIFKWVQRNDSASKDMKMSDNPSSERSPAAAHH